MPSTEIGGTIFFKIDGAQQQVTGKITVEYGGNVRTPVVGSNGEVLGDTVKHEPPTVEVEVADSGSTSAKALQRLSGVTLTMELGNGKTLVLERATQMMAPKHDLEAGTMGLKFYGKSIQEIMA